MAEVLKPIVLDNETSQRLWSLYRASFPRREDAARNFETFKWICTSQSVQMFEGPNGVILYLTDVYPDVPTASLHILNEDKWALRHKAEIREAIRQLMQMFYLQRLAVFLPEPVESVSHLFEYLGFTKEGTLRKHVKFNGEYVGMVCFGLLRDEAEATLAERTFGKKASA